MKKLAKRIAALAMTAAMMTASAGAITQDGQSETWFDGVWALIDAFGLKAEHDPYVLQNYINKYLEKHPDEMYDVLNDILSLLDTHSMYLSSEEYSQGFSTLEGFVGIGVGLQETENGVQIAEVMRYSAAEEAGLQIGDLIVKINGEDATKLKNADVASTLRGEEGTSVKLTVRRYGRDITVTCERRQVNRVYVSNKTMADGVEYIKVSAIGSQNDWSAFSEIWDSLPSKNTRAVILDLRGNGGGGDNILQPIADLLLPEGLIFYTEDHDGNRQEYRSNAYKVGLPMVVLCDENTASASEVLIASLQDYKAATIMGTTTFGKAIGQSTYTVAEDGSGLHLTTVRAYSPLGRNWHGEGLEPDIVVEQPEELKSNPLLRTEENDVQFIEGMKQLRSMIAGE